jgi:hypothetical protein
MLEELYFFRGKYCAALIWLLMVALILLVLNHVKGKVEEQGGHQHGMLPSRGSIQNCATQLHQLGQDLIPFEKVDCWLGEMHQFHFEKMVRFLLKVFSLREISLSEPVELCITLDGAELTKDFCHLTFGIKVTDPRAINP